VHDFRFSSSTPCDRIVVEYIDPAAGDPSDDEPDEVERLIVFEFVFPDPRVDLLERHSILARRVARSATTGEYRLLRGMALHCLSGKSYLVSNAVLQGLRKKHSSLRP
jgi:hypothetical protein